MLFRRNATARRAEAGFVLIEVLVAVGVAAALMAVLIRSFSQTWSGIAIVREEAEATMLGRAMIADASQRGKLVAGAQEGVAGRYAWKMTTLLQPAPATAALQQKQQQQQDGDAKSPPTALYHVILVLVGPSGRSNRLDTLEIGQQAQ
jgi:type II secretory pathway pseudopilin PulG